MIRFVSFSWTKSFPKSTRSRPWGYYKLDWIFAQFQTKLDSIPTEKFGLGSSCLSAQGRVPDFTQITLHRSCHAFAFLNNHLSGITVQLSPLGPHPEFKKFKFFKIQSLILGDLSASMSAVDGGSPIHSRGGGAGTARRSSLAPPPAFSSIVVQLVAMQILALGVSFNPVSFWSLLKKRNPPKNKAISIELKEIKQVWWSDDHLFAVCRRPCRSLMIPKWKIYIIMYTLFPPPKPPAVQPHFIGETFSNLNLSIW